MKTNILSLLAIAGLLTFAGCANDDTTNNNNDQEPGTEGLTSFVEEDQATRTTGEYDGSGLNFYWTAGDRLWGNTGTTTTPVLTQDSKNNINSTLVNNPTNSSAVKRVDKAKFYFAGTFTASSYPVRYTGKNGAKDKVTIKAAQSQSIPNDASHIGEDGDFGVATATKPVGSGKYHFTLDHKAAYITFMPYTTQSWGPNAVIQKIRIFTGNTSDALAGTFDLADDGTLSNPASTSNSVELDVRGGVWNGGLSIPSTVTYATNAVTMVVNPGTYSNVSIEYTLHDPTTHIFGTITKTYPSVTFAAGRNKKVKTDLQVTEYPSDDYYSWDALDNHHFWYNHTADQPTVNNTSNSNYPQNNSDSRWYNEVQGYSGGSTAVKASRSCKDCPNVNEFFWYAHKDYGDPHWDAETLWATMGHLYKGGMWFKKKAAIGSSFNPNQAPDGTDYTKSTSDVSFNYYSAYGKNVPNIATEPLSNPSDYFYLPALGTYGGGGTLGSVGYAGYYWLSTPTPWYTTHAYRLYFDSGGVSVDNHYRFDGYRRWVAQ